MKIYTLPIDKKFQTEKQAYSYPQHNDDFGVEQDFHDYLLSHNELLTQNPVLADWHYLPMYWTHWHVNHGHDKESLRELQQKVNSTILNDKKTFTICQYDDGPMINLGQTLVFLASRMGDTGIDIPLLSRPHKIPFLKIKKRYLASFIGSLQSHPVREIMARALKNKKEIYIFDSHKKRSALGQKLLQLYIVLRYGNRSRFFVKKTLQSYISLCPRGYGGSSFRFFEAMQLGVVPLLLGDIDTRPFKKFIDWDSISFYANDAEKLMDALNAKTEEELIVMGKKVQETYEQKIVYQKWCPFLIKELKNYEY